MNIRELLKNGPLILDGATGTNLQKMGMPMGVCPEQWIIENREVMQRLEREFIEAGSQVIYAPTFGANRMKLGEYHLENHVESINKTLVQIAREVAGDRCLVAGDITMTGQMLAPVGNIDFDDMVDCYKEQAKAMEEAGVDLFVIETMMHIGEARAALLAVKEVSSLPVIVTMTVESSGRTMYGTSAAAALVTLESMGADAVGLNCSTGPDQMISLIRKMRDYATVPLVVKPNAGLPVLSGNETTYTMDKEDFALHMKALVEAGASIVGGCCGTTPEYIRCLRETVQGMDVFIPDKKSVRALTGERCLLQIPLDGPFKVIGERINPTGKKVLKEELKKGCYDSVQAMAVSQVENGAQILDINVGMSGIDEKQTMLQALNAVNEVVDVPLCIDSSDPEVVEAALRRYHGRALVNSVSCEKIKLEQLLPAVKKYGAMFIMLPLTDEGLPENFLQRRENLDRIMDKALKLGFEREDMVADGLVATLGANAGAGLDTLQTIRYCHDTLKIATVCGLSNISFGLPDRSYVNSIFLALAISRGLTMAIANPSQELLMRSAFAADLVMNKPEASLRYIENAASYKKESGEPGNTQGSDRSAVGADTKKTEPFSVKEVQREVMGDIYDDVIKGRKKMISQHIQGALDKGASPASILDESLIPAINQVGEYFNAKTYFLPQLMISAETMRKGVAVLEPLLQEDARSVGWTVVIATVEGDIHDIGKNLVAMMMKNYGFNVIDLGKDVPARQIIDAAKEHHADIIALSALMTTTMQRMRDVVNLARQEGIGAKIIIGGAVITQDYADEIGADGYSEDAVGAVALVRRLMENP